MCDVEYMNYVCNVEYMNYVCDVEYMNYVRNYDTVLLLALLIEPAEQFFLT